MLNKSEFEYLLEQSESKYLDFKSVMYDFNTPLGMSKFTKDVIAFSNTERNKTAYIIIGIEERSDKTKSLVGTDKVIDDAIIQEKVKDKIYPKPEFKSYSIEYGLRTFCVFEFPIKKYSMPLTSVVKMKGLEIGKVYFRRGSANSEAIGHEVIDISDWLRSLPEHVGIDEINLFIKRLSHGSEKLSDILTEILTWANYSKQDELSYFCKHELTGVEASFIDGPEGKYSYRFQKVRISYQDISNQYIPTENPNQVKSMMDNSGDFWDFKVMISQSVFWIETRLEMFKSKPSLFAVIRSNNEKLNLKPKAAKDQFPVFIYLFKTNFDSLYERVKQETINKLLEIKSRTK